MGNKANAPAAQKPNKFKLFSKFKSKKPIQSDKFIIDFNQSYNCKLSRVTDIKSLDTRRMVFVSVIGLYQTYKQCPSYILYTAIFILAIKKDWIYNLSKYINKNDPYISQLNNLTIFDSETEFDKFIQLLQWKDSQGLLFCMLDEYKHSQISLVNPFWVYLSNKLCKLNIKFNPLHLNDQWWENVYEKNKYKSKFNVETTDVLNELYFMTMKFNTIKEILYQSHPNLLNPVSFYGENNDRFQRCTTLTNFFCVPENDKELYINENDDGDWYISIDYEYD